MSWLRSPDGLRWSLRGVTLLLAVGLISSLVVGAARPARPHVAPDSATAGFDAHSAPTSRVPGFGQIGFRVVSGDGTVSPLRCALLADKPANRTQGMQGRTDLAGYDAMVFRWVGTTSQLFINRGVPIALSLAWFDQAGVFAGDTTMPVCRLDCPTYPPPLAAFHEAVEVPAGGLGHLGIGQGSALFLGGHC